MIKLIIYISFKQINIEHLIFIEKTKLILCPKYNTKITVICIVLIQISHPRQSV